MSNNQRLSVVLATYNEEKNIGKCLDSVKDIAYEIVIVDGSSQDKTREIAQNFGARIVKTDNPKNFHINKEKAINLAMGDWILQLDADEVVTPQLGNEILEIISMTKEEIESYQKNLSQSELFLRHKKLIEERDGKIGQDEGDFVAFFIPRANYFLGKYLRYGGVYPDGVIRLFKRGKAYLPARDVHEQMIVSGKVGWLQNDLLHIADPTFGRYLKRNSRYVDLIVDDFSKRKIRKNFIEGVKYFIVKPIYWFLLTQIRHKGILDGIQGVIFSFFSALRFPRSYWRYLLKKDDVENSN